MYDIERITKIINDIEKYKKELEEFKIKSKRDLEDTKTLHASAMVCLAILSRTIDLGQEILVKENMPMPGRYADIFLSLAKAGVLSKKEAEDINKLIVFRNAIAHNYFDLNKDEIFRIISNIKLIDLAIERIKKRVRK